MPVRGVGLHSGVGWFHTLTADTHKLRPENETSLQAEGGRARKLRVNAGKLRQMCLDILLLYRTLDPTGRQRNTASVMRLRGDV